MGLACSTLMDSITLLAGPGECKFLFHVIILIKITVLYSSTKLLVFNNRYVSYYIIYFSFLFRHITIVIKISTISVSVYCN